MSVLILLIVIRTEHIRFRSSLHPKGEHHPLVANSSDDVIRSEGDPVGVEGENAISSGALNENRRAPETSTASPVSRVDRAVSSQLQELDGIRAQVNIERCCRRDGVGQDVLVDLGQPARVVGPAHDCRSVDITSEVRIRHPIAVAVQSPALRSTLSQP